MNGDFKVKCVKESEAFTEGKIYLISNGHIIDDDECMYQRMTSVNDLNNYFFTKFELIDLSIKDQLLEWSKEYGIVVELNDEELLYLFNNRFLSEYNWEVGLDDYNDDLIAKNYNNSCDIFAIHKIDVQNINKITDILDIEKLELLWEREPEVKEVTLKEIDDKFGCKVELIDEEDIHPKRRVTMGDIEKEFGCKIKIIKE